MMNLYLVIFFFQAEDGIRDDLVTGVQTCALPILMCARIWSDFMIEITVEMLQSSTAQVDILCLRYLKIGRASCRERV